MQKSESAFPVGSCLGAFAAAAVASWYASWDGMGGGFWLPSLITLVFLTFFVAGLVSLRGTTRWLGVGLALAIVLTAAAGPVAHERQVNRTLDVLDQIIVKLESLRKRSGQYPLTQEEAERTLGLRFPERVLYLGRRPDNGRPSFSLHFTAGGNRYMNYSSETKAWSTHG